MTPEQINREIAERIMGAHEGPPFDFSRMFSTNGSWLIHDGSRNHYVQNYSEFNPAERIDHAWMVVEKFAEYDLRKRHIKGKAKYGCAIFGKLGKEFRGEAATAPMAICLAALEAVK